MPRVGGPSEGRRRLLATVAGSTALYAAAIRADMAPQTKTNDKALRAVQRPVAIRLCRAYRRVSYEALVVLARVTPWDLKAQERSSLCADRDQDRVVAEERTLNQ